MDRSYQLQVFWTFTGLFGLIFLLGVALIVNFTREIRRVRGESDLLKLKGFRLVGVAMSALGGLGVLFIAVSAPISPLYVNNRAVSLIITIAVFLALALLAALMARGYLRAHRGVALEDDEKQGWDELNS